MRRPATISVDLDNLWAYLRNHGDSTWRERPDFLAVAIPRILALLDEFDLSATFFAVGSDLERPSLRAHFDKIAENGNELANHSYSHRSDIHRISRDAFRDELNRTEKSIHEITGSNPRGFRGPSFRLSPIMREELLIHGYRYDSSLFPTVAGPLARAYHFATSRLDEADKELQKDLFGNLKDGLGTLKPFQWCQAEHSLIEIPVTTFPYFRTPIHMTYVNFIADRSERLAELYFHAAAATCAVRNIPYTLLLHAADFIGSDDAESPEFLPGMKRDSVLKIDTLRNVLHALSAKFHLSTIGAFVDSIEHPEKLPAKFV